jgi:Concanavalin A-like lectin/glucanases superfamily
VSDASGNGNNGTIVGAIWTAGGKYGNALSFNGSSSYVDLGNRALLQITGSVTWSAWVKAAANPPDDGQIVAKSSDASGWQFKTSPDTGSQTFGVAVSGATSGFAQRYSTTVRSLNVWYYVAGVYNATARTLDIYVNGVRNNGVLTGTIPASQVNSAVNVNIGRRTGGYYFNGIIDEVRIYNRALSQAEIQADMNTPIGSPPPTPTPTATPAPGLVAAYGFNEGSGTVVHDVSGRGNNGSISGATWTTSGKYGDALSFNGTNARVNINNATSLQLTSGMTLEAWVYPTSVSSAWRDVIYKGNDNYYLEGTSPNSSRPAMGGTFGGNLYGTSPLTANTWAYLAASYDGATMRLYVNGVQVASRAQTGAIAISTNPLQIGGDSIYGQYFAGRIDEVRIYNRALSAAQIQSDMNTPL